MAWLENGKLISDAESRELIAEKGYQFFEGVLVSPDKANDLIRSGHTQSHLSVGLRYTFTPKEAKSLRFLGVGVLSVGLVSWRIGKFAKSKFDNRKKRNL